MIQRQSLFYLYFLTLFIFLKAQSEENNKVIAYTSGDSKLVTEPLVNNNPIVGLVTYYSGGWDGYSKDKWNYFPSSYVKFLEAAGAQVVPVQWDTPFDQLDDLLGHLNGILLPGGNIRVGNNTDPTPIYLAMKHIVEYALNQNRNGNFYPIWGTCMGLELITRIIANNISIFTHCENCTNVSKNNFPVSDYMSKMLRDLPNDLRDKITYANLSFFNHVNKLDPIAFAENAALAEQLKPVAYTFDASGANYVSMVESPKYPVYGIQFHQEKSTFEWEPELNINHSFDAIRFEQYLANFFVQETRKNRNTFPNNQTYLIDNYNTTVLPDLPFNQIYLFPTNNTLNGLVVEPGEEEEEAAGGFLRLHRPCP